jgi:hypothetical protein
VWFGAATGSSFFVAVFSTFSILSSVSRRH